MCFNELQRVLQGYCSKAVTCRNSTRNASRCAAVAVCCDELQCVTECDREQFKGCSVGDCVEMRGCSVLQCVAMSCNELQ